MSSDTAVRVRSPSRDCSARGLAGMSNAKSFCGSIFSGRRIHRATLTRDGHPGRIETVELDRDVGVVAPAAAGGYVAAATLSFFLFVDESGTATELASLTDAPSGVRFNDGACDERGRFWVGTMAYDKSPGAGALYRLELDGSISTVLTGLTIPNGIGWSPDGSVMYLNDSGTGCLYGFDFDLSTGELGNRRTLVAFEQPGPAPYGLTIDDRGDIWVAVYGGCAVHHYSPDGNLLGRVQLPGRPGDLLCVRRSGPRHAVCHDRPRAARRAGACTPARRRTGVPGHGPRRARARLQPLPRLTSRISRRVKPKPEGRKRWPPQQNAFAPKRTRPIAARRPCLPPGRPSRARPPHPRFHPSPTLRSSLIVTPALWWRPTGRSTGDACPGLTPQLVRDRCWTARRDRFGWPRSGSTCPAPGPMSRAPTPC